MNLKWVSLQYKKNAVIVDGFSRCSARKNTMSICLVLFFVFVSNEKCHEIFILFEFPLNFRKEFMYTVHYGYLWSLLPSKGTHK